MFNSRSGLYMCVIGLAACAWEPGTARAMQLAETAEQEVIELHPLQNLMAENAQRTLSALFPGDTRIGVETKSNSLILRGPASEVEKISKILREIELLASKAADQASVVGRIEYVPPAMSKNAVVSIAVHPSDKSLDELRNEHRQLEEQCLRVAEQLRKSPKDSTNQTDLADLVQRTFDVRQQLQHAELAASARRLQRIQEMIEMRDGLRTQITQRRVEELLSPKFSNASGEYRNPSTETEEEPQVNIATADPMYNANSNNAANSNALIVGGGVLGVSPLDIRTQLRGKADQVTQSQDFLKAILAKKIHGSEADAQQEIQRNVEELEFAKLQLHQIIEHLELMMANFRSKQAEAHEEIKRVQSMFEKGIVPQAELNAAKVRAQELDVETHRLQSLLKLYQAAGSLPKLGAESTLEPSDTEPKKP